MNRQTILLAILIITLAAIAYIWLQYAAEPRPDLSGQESPAESPEETLANLRRLKEITLDTSVFQDRFFRSLTEPALTPESPIQPGRANPFEPL